MGCQAGIGVAGDTGPQGCIGPNAGEAWAGRGACMAAESCEGAGIGVTGDAVLGVGVNEIFTGTVEFCDRLSMAGCDVAGAGVGEGYGAAAGGLKCTSAKTTSDDRRTMMIARALRSILASQRIIIFSHINKML